MVQYLPCCQDGRTNVFCIGFNANSFQIECCITGYQYTHPFQTQKGHIEGRPQGTSYAWRLHDDQDDVNLYPEADGQLRKIISQCMKEKPELRPTLVQLLKWVYEAQKEGKLSDNDESCDFWWAATDPKEYREACDHPDGKATQLKPLSFEQANSQAKTELDVLRAANPVSQRFALDDSSSYGPLKKLRGLPRPPQWPSNSETSGPAFKQKKPCNFDDAEMQDVDLLKRSSKRARPDEGLQAPPESKRKRATKQGLQEAAKRSKHAMRDGKRIREALMPPGPAIRWEDRTGLSDALKRELALSGSPDKKQAEEEKDNGDKQDEKPRPFMALPRLNFTGSQ